MKSSRPGACAFPLMTTARRGAPGASEGPFLRDDERAGAQDHARGAGEGAGSSCREPLDGGGVDRRRWTRYRRGGNEREDRRDLCRVRGRGDTLRGGHGALRLPNNGYLYGVYDYPGNTGDGYCLAYRAGAELSGFEYTLIYYIVKDINAPLLYITLTRGAKLLNAFGFDKSREHPSIKSMLVDHHREGSGPMRIVMSHLPEERIRSIEEILLRPSARCRSVFTEAGAWISAPARSSCGRRSAFSAAGTG